MNRALTLAAILFAPCLLAAGERKAGSIVVEPVTLKAASGGAPIDGELGTLFVPENRADPKSRIIGVGFARFRASQPSDAPPLFILPGGPGNSYLMNLAGAASGIQRYRQVGDVVLVDQRGYSPRGEVLSFPNRRLEEPLDEPANLARSTAAAVKFAREAVAALERKGIDLRGYTVKECAHDVNDLRKALGYERMSLVGTSFGSQWSFAILRLHPEIITRALLSGVEPLDFGYDMPSHIVAGLQRMWWQAEKDARLKPYVPPGGIMAAARAVIERLERKPVHVSLKDEKTGREITVCLGREDFQRDLARSTPAFVLSAYHEHYDAWAKRVLARRRGQGPGAPPIGWLIDTSLGVTPKRAYLLRTDPGGDLLGHWNFDAYMATAGIWPSPDVGDAFRTETVNQTPVVFVQGDWDVQTPLENALYVAPFFPKSRVVIAEHGGHGALGSIAQQQPAVMAKLLDFLRTGNQANIPARVTLAVSRFEVPDFPPHAAAGQ
jgi:pimeloyl-ACP methyl ester carboxylesterase